MKYLIWSVEHRGWWKASRHGYTTATHMAGRFSDAESRDICTQANRYLMPHETPEEIRVPAPAVDTCMNDLIDLTDIPEAGEKWFAQAKVKNPE